MIDIYSKVVLTVIATALCALVAQNFIQPASAIGDGCGSRSDPCYVRAKRDLPVKVRGSVHVYGTVSTYQ